MITKDKRWHYLLVTKQSTLFKRITSNNNCDYCCLNCFNSYTAENILRSHDLICKNHNYCHIEISKEGYNISKYKQGEVIKLH